MTPFGQRMRELRAERGLTQQQQAEQLGVSKAYISLSRLANGAGHPLRLSTRFAPGLG